MVVMEDEQITQRIGNLDFTVKRAEDRPENRPRWDRRVDVLTAWLLAEWQREHGENN